MQYINKSVCRGVAGRRARGWKPLGIVIHNDAGSMTPEAYVNWLAGKTPTQLQSGFAHYYGNRNQMARVEDTYNGAWHVANYNGNMDYVGYEVCESLKVSDKDFIANEEAVFQQAAKDMKEWGLTPSRSTVKIHRRFVPTTCPHRSWDLHVGKGAADTDANRGKMEDYFIARIKHYMNGGDKPAKVETITQGTAKPAASGISYRGNVQSISGKVKAGKLGYVTSGKTCGTTGKGLRLEWIEVLYDGKKGYFELEGHVQRKGWLKASENSTGTVGEALRLEAVRIRIKNPELKAKYKVEYRVHQQTTGWSSWVADGKTAGYTGRAKRLEAIQIRLVKK